MKTLNSIPKQTAAFPAYVVRFCSTHYTSCTYDDHDTMQMNVHKLRQEHDVHLLGNDCVRLYALQSSWSDLREWNQLGYVFFNECYPIVCELSGVINIDYIEWNHNFRIMFRLCLALIHAHRKIQMTTCTCRCDSCNFASQHYPLHIWCAFMRKCRNAALPKTMMLFQNVLSFICHTE